MYDKAISGSEAVRVRSLEARDLTDVLDVFPGATMHVYAGSKRDGVIHRAFDQLSSASGNAWVAEAEDRLIGLAVLAIESQTLAHLTYLHVAGGSPQHASAARALAEIAIREAWNGGYLKLALHTDIPTSSIIEYMHELGFEFARTQSSGGQRVIEFYRNLYEPPRQPSPGVGDIQ
jgi:hypothetical protein